MPIFEYQCDACRTRFEELTLGPGAAQPHCPDCGGSAVRKMHSTFAAQSRDGGAPDGAFCESPSAGTCGTCGQVGPCSLN